MTLFDSHCHLTAEHFAGDLDDVIARARRAGVSGIVTVASELDDARAAARIAATYDDVWCTAGVHPHAAASWTPGALPALRELLAGERVVAIGETGLDYHYDHAPRDAQRDAFRQQLELAAETGLPVVVHSRSADEDTAAMLRDTPRSVRGVLHCFAGGRALLETGLELDWYVSFAGMISFKNYDSADLVRAVPAGRLLAETDSPYLAPVPRRGKRNEPAYVKHVVEALAAMRGGPVEAVAELTAWNARSLYALPLRGPQG